MSIIGDIYEEREDRLMAQLHKAEELLWSIEAFREELGFIKNDRPRRLLGSILLGIEDYREEYLKPHEKCIGCPYCGWNKRRK